ncbi:MAG: AMP-binding protein [Tepidisphaeraceae bacterium]|jgi:long-chain acyl-CoA synthetase
MLVDFLFQHATNAPDDTAVIDDTGQHTHRTLAAAAAGLGVRLGTQTSKPHVGLLLPPSAGFVASFYGTLLAGKTVVPINYLLGDREIAHVIEDSGIDTVISSPPLAARIQGMGLKVIDPSVLPKQSPAIAPVFPGIGPDDLAVLMYTSGTSGRPKGVMLTYGNLQSDTDAAIAHVRLDREHVFLGVIPLFHSFGMTAMMLAPIQLGAPVIYLSRFSPIGSIEAIRRHKPSILFAVPSMFAAMLRLQSAKGDDFASFYALISGGEALPTAVREGFFHRFGTPIYEGYGLTETSPVTHINVPQCNRPGSVGKPVPGCEMRIVDDEGRPLPQGQSGEVWLSGPMIMKGYYNLPGETAEALTADGYFKTGDLGRIDEDGFLYITGRKKDIIISAGEKVVPREVEEVLARHSQVAEVSVVGRRDPTRGEAVVAFVVAQTGQTIESESLRAFCRSQGLVSFKIPRDIFIVSDLPRSPTGKVIKRELQARADRMPA